MNLSIPTAVMHPKDEVVEQKDLIWCSIHTDLVNKLAQALADARDDKPHRRVKRKDREAFKPPQQATVQPIQKLETKISLFDDVDDDYTPSVPFPESHRLASPASTSIDVTSGASNAMDVVPPSIGPSKPTDDGDYGYPDPDSYEVPPKRQKMD
jgi:hypothetical protein